MLTFPSVFFSPAISARACAIAPCGVGFGPRLGIPIPSMAVMRAVRLSSWVCTGRSDGMMVLLRVSARMRIYSGRSFGLVSLGLCVHEGCFAAQVPAGIQIGSSHTLDRGLAHRPGCLGVFEVTTHMQLSTLAPDVGYRLNRLLEPGSDDFVPGHGAGDTTGSSSEGESDHAADRATEGARHCRQSMVLRSHRSRQAGGDQHEGNLPTHGVLKTMLKSLERAAKHGAGLPHVGAFDHSTRRVPEMGRREQRHRSCFENHAAPFTGARAFNIR